MRDSDPSISHCEAPELSNSTSFVNTGSLLGVALLFTIMVPSVASAERVALLPLGGRADSERLDEIGGTMARALRARGHEVVGTTTTVPHPPTSAQLEELGASSRAVYVVTAEVEPLRAQYRLHIHVFYRPAGRLEELVATVMDAEEEERLADILSSMVRRQGLGEDALRLTGQEDPAEAARLEEERRQREAAEAARLEEEARAQREAEEAAQREEAERLEREAAEAARLEEEALAQREAEEARTEQEAWDERVPYGGDAPWMVQVVLGGGYAAGLAQLPSGAQAGGGLFDLGLRAGRSFEGLDGFELRGGLDFATGAFTAVGIHVGAAWLGSFFLEPIFIGLGGEIGVIFTVTGARDVGFSGRVSALFAWRPAEHISLEVSIPELGYVSPGTGAVTIGASVRAGYRF